MSTVLELEIELEGSPNPLALLLCRGAGECGLDWEDPATFENWENKLICEEHIHEFLTRWSWIRYHHFKYKRVSHQKVVIFFLMNDKQ